jgi:cell division protein FtsL
MTGSTWQSQARPSLSLLLVLVLLVVLSALAVSWSVYHTRNLTSRVQALKAEQNQLNVEWGQLQLENSTWGAYVRIQKLAKDQLGMVSPGPAQRVVVSP